MANSEYQPFDALIKDIHANSARKPSASLLRTWSEMHKAWFGNEPAPWPLSVHGIFAVASVMKHQGYRSFANYASAAKEKQGV